LARRTGHKEAPDAVTNLEAVQKHAAEGLKSSGQALRPRSPNLFGVRPRFGSEGQEAVAR
jgi:hypothetical protein